MTRSLSHPITMSLAALALATVSSSPALADLSRGQQLCTTNLTKGMRLIDKQANKQVFRCIRNNAKGRPLNRQNPSIDTMDECVQDDPRGAIGRQESRLGIDFTKRCTAPPSGNLTDPFPPFAATSEETVRAAAREPNRALAHDIFQLDLDGGVLRTDAVDRDAATCQHQVWKAVSKCEDIRFREFWKCEKRGLKGRGPGLIDSAADLRNLCMGTGGADQWNTRNIIQKKCAGQRGIQRILNRKCGGQSLSSLFPATGTSSVALTAQRMDDRVQCRVCLAVNRAKGIDRDCDLFDDGAANLSCACGDGQLNAGEQCDDGNNTDHDGCDFACRREIL